MPLPPLLRDLERRARRDDHAPAGNGRIALAVAALALLAVRHYVPYGTTILYPLNLFGTWVHEMGHGLGAMITGGAIDYLEIFSNGSGLAHTRTISEIGYAVCCLSGSLGVSALGAAILGMSGNPRRARIVLLALAAGLVISCLLWVRTFAGWLAMPIMAAVFAAGGTFASAHLRTVLAYFVGVMLVFDNIVGIRGLFQPYAFIGGQMRATDMELVAMTLGGPYWFWGALVAAASVLLGAIGIASVLGVQLPFGRVWQRVRAAVSRR